MVMEPAEDEGADAFVVWFASTLLLARVCREAVWTPFEQHRKKVSPQCNYDPILNFISYIIFSCWTVKNFALGSIY